MAKVIDCKTGTVVDSETGEVITEIRVREIKGGEPYYVKIYLDHLRAIASLPKSQIDVLMAILHYLDFDGVVRLTAARREKVTELLGVNRQVLRNKLSELGKAGVLNRTATSEYQINPYFFARGDWKQIERNREKFKPSDKRDTE